VATHLQHEGAVTRIVATIEARMGSTRLPGKVLLEAAGRPLLAHMIERVRRARYVDEIVVATTTNGRDDAIMALCDRERVLAFRGSEEDVLGRVVAAAGHHHADICVLLTGDSPLIDPLVVDQHVVTFLAAQPHVDYVTNCEVSSYPVGLAVQVLAARTLAATAALTADHPPTSPFREHVGWYVRRHPERYRRLDVVAPPGLSNPHFRMTLDTPEDYRRIRTAFERLYPADPSFGTAALLELGREQGWIDS
jgi:spore coat polysaccharide biosynthesis protein SpsF